MDQTLDNLNNNDNSELVSLLKEQIASQSELIEAMKAQQGNGKGRAHIQDSKQRTTAGANGDKLDGGVLSRFNDINVTEILMALLRGWWIILLCTVIAAVGCYAWCMKDYVPSYTASAKMYVNNESISVGSAKVSISSGDISASAQLIDTYSVILKTHFVLDMVGYELQNNGYPGYSYDSLITKVTCNAVDETGVFEVSIVDTNPKTAITIVNTIIEILPDQIETVISGTTAKTVDRAQTAKLNGSGIGKKTIIAGIIGLLAACIEIFIVDYLLNDTIESSAWLSQNYSNYPVLGEIPDVNRSNKKRYGKYGYKNYSKGYGHRSAYNNDYYGYGYYRSTSSDKAEDLPAKDNNQVEGK